jgi:hypothetical protein
MRFVRPKAASCSSVAGDDACSMPSTPTATAWSTAAAEWA